MKNATVKSFTWVHGLMLLMILLASSSFPVGAAITNGLEPAVLMFVRFSFAAAIFAPYIFFKHGFRLISWKDFLRYAVLSAPVVAFFWCMFEALRHTSALNTGALFTLVPGITGLYAWLLNREKLGGTRALGLIIGMLGALWINFRGDLDSLFRFAFNQGDLIFLAGCFSMALHGPLVKRFYRNEPMEVMTFWILITGGLEFLLIAGPELGHVQWTQVGMDIYGGIVYLAIFSTLCTFFLAQYSTVRIGATKVSAYTYLTPVFVLGINFVIGQPAPLWDVLPGVLLVVTAMFIIQRGSLRFELRSKQPSWGRA